MRHIDITNKKPKQEWLDKANKLTQELLTITDETERKNFINKHQNIWKDLEGFLNELSHGKCWYSEARDCASYWHVDHFRPKNEIKDLDGNKSEGYWWLAFDWTNYRLAGSALNVPKSSKFPLRSGTYRANNPRDDINDEHPYLLDPIQPEDPGLLSFDESGNTVPSDTGNSWNKSRAEVSIDILNLNHGTLVSERHRIWKYCDLKINYTLNLMNKINDKNSTTKKTLFQKAIIELRDMVSEKQPFSAVVKTCVLSQGIPWLTRMIFN